MQRLTRAQSRLLNVQTPPPANEEALDAQNHSRRDGSSSNVPQLKKRQRESLIDMNELKDAPALKKAKKDTLPEMPQITPAVESERAQQAITNCLNVKTVMQDHDAESLAKFLRSPQCTPVRRAALLHEAVRLGWLKGIDTLCESGALNDALNMDLNLKKNGRPTMFQTAASLEDRAILDHLNKLADPLRQKRREDVRQALLHAAHRSDLPTLQHCCITADMEEVLWTAADMSQFICEAISDTRPRSDNAVTGAKVIAYLAAHYPGKVVSSTYDAALRGAVRTNNWQAASVLLGEIGVDPNTSDPFGQTALMHAAQKGHYNIYELLRFHDASPHAQDENGMSVLHHAVEGGNIEIVNDLVKNAKVDISTTSGDNYTAATRASLLGKQVIAESIRHSLFSRFDRTDF